MDDDTGRKMRQWVDTQLAIDERLAEAAPDGDREAARILREVDAKRRLLARHGDDDAVVQLLALGYDSRTGYQEDWRP